MEQRAAQDIERARAILQLCRFARLLARRRRFVAHPFELIAAHKEANRVGRRVIFFLRRRPALETNRFQSSGGKLLRQNTAGPTDSHDADIGNGLRHINPLQPSGNQPPRWVNPLAC